MVNVVSVNGNPNMKKGYTDMLLSSFFEGYRMLEPVSNYCTLINLK